MTTYYEIMHKNTQDQHYDGKTWQGSPVVIDTAELSPGEFETVVLHSSGRVIACIESGSLSDARKAYHKLLDQYTKKPAEPAPVVLTGKYAKLRDDLREALAAGRAAEQADSEDGGTCNFDSAALSLPRWRKSLIEQAAKEAGTVCFEWDLYQCKHFVFCPDTRCQANARSRNAEAMTAALRRMGYDAMDYSQMD